MRYCILLSFLFIQLALFGQNEVQIGLKSSSESEAIPFAKVMIRASKLFAMSDMEGNVTFENVPPGEHLLEVVVTGYVAYSETISISKDLHLDIELTSEFQSIDEIVISGTMKEVSKKASTVNVEVYSPKFFKKNPTPSVYDALQNINGVRPQLNCNICNTGDIHINGLEGPYTMMLIDGMPIVSSLSTVYGLSGIPNSLIERIEVVKGPASTLYGSEAMGGVINIITKRPENAPVVSADVFTTSWLETNADLGLRFGIGTRIKEKSPLSTYMPNRPIWDVLTGINYYNYNNPIDNNNDGFTDVTLQNRISIFQKWKYNPKKSNRLVSIAGRYLYEDRWGGQMDWNSNFRGGDSLYGESVYTSRWELLGMYQLPIKERVFLTGSFNRHQQNSYYGDVFYLADQITGFAQGYWDKHIGNHDFIVGTAVRYINYDDNTPATATNDSMNPQNMRNIQWISGVYAQDEIKFGKHHKLLLGSRLDYHLNHGLIFTPRLGYKWMSEKLHILRLNAGTGFRVVNIFTEDHAALTGAREVIIEDNISPEESYNVNLNYSKTFITKKNKMIGLDLTAFYTYFTNRIIADYDSDPNEIRYANLNGHAVSQGVSANLTLKLLPGLSVQTGATLMDIYAVSDGVHSDQILTENFTATWAVSYDIPRTKFTVDYTGNLYSPMRLPLLNELDPRPEYSPWWSIQNIQVTYNGVDNWEIYGGVKNLLNWTPEKGTPFQIARANDPFDSQVTFDGNGDAVPTANNPYGLTFDPTYVYGPNQGIRGFLGVRYTFD